MKNYDILFVWFCFVSFNGFKINFNIIINTRGADITTEISKLEENI